MLKNIDKLTEFHTGITARIGIPAEQLANGNLEQLYSPVYSTVVGLLLKGIEKVEAGELVYTHEVKAPVKEKEEVTEEILTAEDKSYSKVFKRIRDWFEAEPDAEYY